MECAGMYQPLFVVSGSCQGIEISLDTAAIPFGAVAQRSSSSRKLLMQNTGDIGSRYMNNYALNLEVRNRFFNVNYATNLQGLVT